MQLWSGVAFLLLAMSQGDAAAAKVKFNTLTTLCSRSDPNLNECVTKGATQILPALAKGIREYNLVPMNPLKIPFIALDNADLPVGIKLNISNTIHKGIAGLQFKASRIDLKTLHWEIDTLVPRYELTGTCDVGGRILLLPISGHGPCNLTSVGHDLGLIMDGKLEEKNGKQYVKLTKFQTKMKFIKGYFKLEGLFGGNKELGDTMNRFLNDNGVEVLNEMKPILQIVWSELFRSLLQNVLDHVPYDELFLP